MRKPAVYRDWTYSCMASSPQAGLPRDFLDRQLLPKSPPCCGRFGFPGLRQRFGDSGDSGDSRSRPNPLRCFPRSRPRLPGNASSAAQPMPFRAPRFFTCQLSPPRPDWLLAAPAPPLLRAHWFNLRVRPAPAPHRPCLRVQAESFRTVPSRPP